MIYKAFLFLGDAKGLLFVYTKMPDLERSDVANL